MASFAKLSDNEMNYYKFKARAMLLQKKEEKEWQDFCKQVAPDCVDCVTKKADVKESKDVAIQTFPKNPILRTDKTPLQPKYKKEEIPEALADIKTRLDKMDLFFSKLLDESPENKEVSQKYMLSEKKPIIQERNPMAFSTPTIPRQQAVKTFEEQRKLQIQNSFKTSLQNSTFVVHKKPPAIKPKNSSFFLPHDLEVKRAASRKAYLASLQTKPKVSFQNKTVKQPSSNVKAKTSQSKKIVPIRKKILPKKENQKSKESTEETKEKEVKDFVAEDTKDENIEGVVDAILDDLLGETALDINRIRHKKKDIIAKRKTSFVPCNPSSSSSAKCDSSKLVENNNSSIMKLKMFIDSSDVIHEENKLRKEQVELENKRTTAHNIEDSKSVHAKRMTATIAFQRIQEAPKFVCGVTNVIKIDPEKAKDIISRRDRFWRYLESISRTVKGYRNPWILNESLAESILDDCIRDIAEELSEVPSNIIQDLYNQEFVQQVET